VRSSSSLAALCLLLVTAASASAAATEEDSKTFFAQGRKLRADGNCADAIVAFHRALDVFPQGLGALRNIAECEEQLGQFASARNDWWSLRRAVLQNGEPKYQGWENDAEAGYLRLAAKVAKIVVKIHGAEPTQVRVAIDGKPLDPRLIGVELERDLGTHTIEATYGGAAPVIEKRTLTTGAHEEVTLEIPAMKQISGAGTPDGGAPDVVTPPDTGGSGVRTGGFVAIGVGGLSAVGALISFLSRQAAIATVVDACGSDATMTCIPRPGISVSKVRAANSNAQTATVLVDVFGGVAIAGVGVGVALVVVGSGSSSTTKTSAPKPTATRALELNVGVSPTIGGAQLWTGGRF
jgi:hypothetical protein